MASVHRIILAWVLVAAAVATATRSAEISVKPVGSAEPGWPQWRGPLRDGICRERGLLGSWPEGGPKVLWTASGLGYGYSSPIITRGTIYITGDVEDELRVFALDLSGKLKWQAANGRSWKSPYPGSRSSCTYDEGRLYHMNAHGRVACLDAETGRELWAVDALERFAGTNISWALSESLLIDRDRVIVTPGGRKGTMVALDKKTGQTVWASEAVVYQGEGDVDRASYSSPILLEVDGRRLIVGCSLRHILGVDAEDGRLLWKYPMPTRFEVLGITPALCRDCIFMTGPDGDGARLLRLRMQGARLGVEEVWSSSIDTCHGGVLLVDDHFYGSWYRRYNGWGCIEAKTGNVLYQTRELPMGSAIWADDHLYCLSQSGIMALVKADPREFRIVSRFRLQGDIRNDAWAHPVILDGRLYLRCHDKLYCYDVKGN